MLKTTWAAMSGELRCAWSGIFPRHFWAHVWLDVPGLHPQATTGAPFFAPAAHLDFLTPVGRSPQPEIHAETTPHGARVRAAARIGREAVPGIPA